MKLYSYFRSGSSWRVRIALAHKEIPYEYVAVHLRKGEQNGDRYRSMNAGRTVPMLEEGEGESTWRLSQSMAIIEYLEERFPQAPLLPRDPHARARARQYAELVNSGIQPLQNLAVTQYLSKHFQGDERAWSQHWISRGLETLETQVAGSVGTFCVGNDVSFADVFLVPQLFSARRFGVNVEVFPRLLEIEAVCSTLPAFQKAHPDRQPDYEP